MARDQCQSAAKYNVARCFNSRLSLCLAICVISNNFSSSADSFQPSYHSLSPKDNDAAQFQQNYNRGYDLFMRLPLPQLLHTNMSTNPIFYDRSGSNSMLQNSSEYYYLDKELHPYEQQDYAVNLIRDVKNSSPMKKKRQLRKMSTRTIKPQQQQTSIRPSDVAQLHKGSEAMFFVNKPLAYHLGAVSNGLYKLPFNRGSQSVDGPVYSNGKGDDENFATSYKQQLNRYYDQETIGAPINADKQSEVVVNVDPPMPITSNRCETIQTNVLLEKDDRDALTGDISRTCWANLRLSKCEGSCLSISRPTMRTLSGFHKVS